MVRLRGIEPLLPGWKPGVLTTKRKPHMVDPAGLEPATARLWAESSNQLSYGSLIMACLKRFELLAHGLEGRCSIQLSYRHIYFLFFWLMVSHTGIEPVTPWLKVMCSTDWANGSYLTLERETRVELATFSLEGWHSTNWVTPAYPLFQFYCWYLNWNKTYIDKSHFTLFQIKCQLFFVTLYSFFFTSHYIDIIWMWKRDTFVSLYIFVL